MDIIDSFFNMNLSFGMAMVNSKLIIKKINKQFSLIFHNEMSDLIGKKLTSFLPEINSALDQNNLYEPKKILGSNGQTLIIDIIKIERNPDVSFLIFCRDNTEAEQISKQNINLNMQVNQYIQMFDNLYDGIFIVDVNGTCMYINDAFVNLSGATRESFLGKTVFETIGQGFSDLSCLAQVLKNRKPVSLIIRYSHSGKNCLVSGTPIYTDGKLVKAIAVIRDLTELQCVQRELETATSLNLTYENKLKEIETKTCYTTVIETRSNIMQKVYDRAIKIASVESPVLLTGETGVGKDYIAKFIHDISDITKSGCLIKVNCGAIPDNLLESELFGYEKGAFTGAGTVGKAGLFELAKNGTLYLDEIGDMPLHLQVKLLSCIQDKKFFRVGGTKSIDLQGRIIAATNADLGNLIAEGRFRPDLYYRLNVINIYIPSLRERKDDIIPFSLHFLDEFNKKFNKTIYFSTKTFELLMDYDWPGNIREMKNVIERLVIISDKECIDPSFFEENIFTNYSGEFNGTHKQSSNYPDDLPLKMKMEQYESVCIKEALDKHNTMQEAANALGIDLSTLVRRKQKYRVSKH